MNVLVTGGAGYIGSHTCIELLNAGHSVTVVDDFSNSKYESLKRVQDITGKTLEFVELNVLDKVALGKVFAANNFDSVIHFAAFKAVGESVSKPLAYYHNNLTGTMMLCEVMQEYGVNNLVFSSSATVYGDPASTPITEDFPTSATNPYGQTKLMMEQILTDLQAANTEMNICLLRYFNPTGAHESGLIGEDPNGIPNNLFPFITQVAVGKREFLSIFGGDYDTVDGTGVRDYIHVVDLADGHVKALEKLATKPGLVIYNLGTGCGYSVLQAVKAFEDATGKPVAYKITDRRPGDIAECWAAPDKAAAELGWTATRGIEEMCRDAWKWQSNNPNGFED